MTAIQINAELLRELSNIVDDESLMQKALNYIRKLGREKTKKAGLGILSRPADPALEAEAQSLYGIFKSDALSDDELADIVSEVRTEVYGTKE